MYKNHRISLVMPCYNEEENIREAYEQVKQVLAQLPDCTYEHIFIDNASKDGTVAILRDIARQDQTLIWKDHYIQEPEDYEYFVL
jgi:glycosyltransferase involved in cell wall biosynthesis